MIAQTFDVTRAERNAAWRRRLHRIGFLSVTVLMLVAVEPRSIDIGDYHAPVLPATVPSYTGIITPNLTAVVGVTTASCAMFPTTTATTANVVTITVGTWQVCSASR